MSDTVLLERTGAVAVVTLNRPDSLNSLIVEMKVALREAVEQVADDDGVRAVVLTGAGRAFCVGQDLREHAGLLEAGDPAPLSTVREHYNPVVTALAEMRKPTDRRDQRDGRGRRPRPGLRARLPRSARPARATRPPSPASA